MADHGLVAEMLMECTPSVYNSRAERTAAIAEILRREYADRAPDPAIEKAREALTLAKEGWDKTGEERVVPFLLRRIDEALALLGEVE
jgi:hypothetical protein